MADLVAPVISRFTISPRSFTAARSGGSITATAGAEVSYRLSERGRTAFGIKRATPGRRVGQKCVAPTRRNRRAGRCTRYLPIRGSFTHVARQGSNRFRFAGRLAGKTLRLGSYRLVARAKDTAGNNSPAAETAFRIKR